MTHRLIWVLSATLVIFGVLATRPANAEKEDASIECSGEDAAQKVDKYLGVWRSKDGRYQIEITKRTFRLADRSEPEEWIGKFTLLEDKLVLDVAPEDDGGYVTVTDRGSIILTQDRVEEKLELFRLN